VTPSTSAAGGPVRILLVEDDPELVDMLSTLLDEEGYQVEAVSDGQRGLHLGMTRPYDVLILDRGLPVLPGLDLLSGLRRHGVTTPALVLSALGTPADRVAGLDAGAEDYLGKPFDIYELLARLRALRRRHLDSSRMLPIGSRRLNLDTREVTSTHPSVESVRLSERECELLTTLAARPGQVFTREYLLHRVFVDADNPVVVDTYVHYLRRKLGRNVVVTVRGRGYQLGREPRT
jgi:two-component system response regulator QseB